MSTQEPPGGWSQPVAVAPPAPNPYAVKYGLGRCWGYGALSFGLWTFYWFYVNRRLLDGETGRGRNDATLHSFGLLVPILNYFILYWLWRDIDELRRRYGMPGFSVGGYLVGAIFLAPVFYSIVLGKLNEYWDVRTQGLATDAPTTSAEKGILIAGAVLLGLYLLFIIVIIVVAIVAGSSS